MMNKEKYEETGSVPRHVLTLSQNHMNTTFVLEVSVSEPLLRFAEHLLEKCHIHLDKLENTLSEFIESSDLGRIGRQEPETEISVSQETIDLCEQSLGVTQWSNQSYDPSFRSKNGLSFEENFRWNRSKNTLAKTRVDSRLSFGAIGKGYALDQVAKSLLTEGIQNFRLSAGGSSIVVYGEEAPAMPWKLGFSWVKENDRYKGIELRPLFTPVFIGVSGTLEQGEHIQSQTPSFVLCKSVLVSAQSAAMADAISTAVFADPSLLQKYIEGACLLVDNKGGFLKNEKFDQSFIVETSS